MQADGESQEGAQTQEKTESHLLVFPLSWSIVSRAYTPPSALRARLLLPCSLSISHAEC